MNCFRSIGEHYNKQHESQNLRPTLAFSILDGPPAALAAFWSKTIPSTISESSIVPPDLVMILMSFRSSLGAWKIGRVRLTVFQPGDITKSNSYRWGRSGSITFKTASTAIGERRYEYCDTTLLLRDLESRMKSVIYWHLLRCKKQKGSWEKTYVVAALISCSLSSRLTGIATPSRICMQLGKLMSSCIPYFYEMDLQSISPTSQAFWAALLKESEITVGWTPFSRSSWAFFNKDPQTTTTDVVPSPATISWYKTSLVRSKIVQKQDLENISPNLWFRKLHEHLSGRLRDGHLLKNRGPIVRDDHLPVGRCNLIGASWMVRCYETRLKQINKSSRVHARTILSMPRGPREVRTASATAFAASMFVVLTSFFLDDSRYISPFAFPPAPGAGADVPAIVQFV